MAKKIIKARIKQCTNTRANWAANNPVLLEGELGIVSDDPNLYKVGDGTTAWNDLPFRGFDGTLVHEIGDSDSAAMSQRGVTQALNELKESMVEKVPGKGLSTEDYTTEEKKKLAELSAEVNEVAKKIDNINPTPMVSVTYAELVGLRDNGELIAGMQYRITDYMTTTAQENTRSAGHQFDVIVTADNENTLNDVARACLHEGDTYFSEAGANLAAWKLWYCLDNDAERFAWASNNEAISNGDSILYRNPSLDTTNNGVLYYAWRNEYEGVTAYTINENPTEGEIVYDDIFAEDWEIIKVITKGKGVIYRMIDEWNNDAPYDFKNIQFKRGIYAEGQGIAKEEGDQDFDVYCYTFSWEDSQQKIMDASLVGNNGYLLNDEGQITGVYGNSIKPYITYTGEVENPREVCQHLNDIVFLSNYAYEGRWYYGCYSNSFGNDCGSNSFGNNCYSNSFGNNCYSNSFGNGCSSNNFGNDCSFNSFGNNCYSNSFGNECFSNSFGNYCYSNSLGNECFSNSFKDMDGIADNCKYNRVDDGVHDVVLYYDDNNGTYSELKNHHICRGVNQRQVEIYSDRDFEVAYTMTSDGELRELVLGDL